MGSTRQLLGAVAAAIALVGCSASDDEGGDSGAATTAEREATAGGGSATTVAAAAASGQSLTGTGDGGEGIIAPSAQVPGQQLAIEARAAVQVGDVRAAVDRLTTAVTTRGGRVAAADVDYDPRPPDPSTGEPDEVDDSRASLVLSLPPGELAPIESTLRELGTVTSFDQLAEDVTEQLADLDNRIANLRASVERVRALLAEAVDIEGIVRLEAELTSRETELERLLATERQLDDRVAMSTLTVDITVAAPPAAAAEAEGDPGVVDALAAGWDAFMTGLHTIALVLAAIAPFVGAAAVLLVIALFVRRIVTGRGRAPAQPPAVP